MNWKLWQIKSCESRPWFNEDGEQIGYITAWQYKRFTPLWWWTWIASIWNLLPYTLRKIKPHFRKEN